MVGRWIRVGIILPTKYSRDKLPISQIREIIGVPEYIPNRSETWECVEHGPALRNSSFANSCLHVGFDLSC